MLEEQFVKFSLKSSDREFAGKVALITGGTRGIGAATAIRVAELGAKVVVTGRCRREGQRLVDEIIGNGGTATFVQADLTQPDEVRLIVPVTLETFALTSTKVLKDLLYELSPLDPTAIITAIGAVACMTVAAAWLPARRATRINPVQALRTE
jgi:NAD(P)-dependent dehydrogenase (short-subunit alcohol dehydrogenase family)